MKMKADYEIKQDVERELEWDTRTWNLKIQVAVKDGVVKLDGVVANYAQRVAMQNAAHRVTGVLDVANEILIKGKHQFSDEDIAHAVRQALIWDVTVPEESITTTVSEGWVTIEGVVDSLTQMLDAERAIENLMGVKGVTNEIKVIMPTADAKMLRDTIEAALERRADREAEKLRIDVMGGQVDLFGRVHSWQERKAVIGSISHAKGVEKINDRLRIDPYF